MTHTFSDFRSRATGAVAACCIAACLTAGALYAGPLNPPTGTITPTAKPLTEVEPRIAINATNTPGDADSVYRIQASGSYYLTETASTSAGKMCIEVAVGSVTIDLNGFRIVGTSTGLAGIGTTSTTLERITIRNGTIVSCSTGIDLDLTARVRVEGVNVDNSRSGNGIHLGQYAQVVGCGARENDQSGIVVGERSLVSDCIAALNQAEGIWTSDDCIVRDCVATRNVQNGIRVGTGSVTNCDASGNDVNGISIFLGTVSGCVARQNDNHGITCSSDSFIINNTCVGNGVTSSTGAGIFVDGEDSRIEANNCTSNDRGISVATAGNLIIKNSCAGNTINWSIVANNVFGTIIDRTSPGSAAVSGNAAGGTIGTTDPNANITY